MRTRNFVTAFIFLHVKMNKLTTYTFFIILVNFEESSPMYLNTSISWDHNKDLTDLRVPDSSLILLDRLISRKLSEIDSYSRKKQKQTIASNSTASAVVTTSSSTTPAPPRRPQGCECELGVCKCCTGLILDLFNQKACMKITYHPGDFAFDVSMSMNDRILYENSLSGKNPRPICISPPRLPNMKVCAQFYNVFFPGRNFHFCLAMQGKWRSAELFNMAFDCLRMGANGIAIVKPEENGGIHIPNPLGGVDAVVDAGDEDIEDYDENIVKSLLDVFDR